MSYSLQTLWHERSRYIPGVLAVAFSAVLMALQFGLMLGLFMITSIPIDHTSPNNVWIGSNDVKSVDLGQPIPESYIARIGTPDGAKPPEPFVANFANFFKPEGGTELCFLLGSKLEPDSAGAADVLTPELRYKLTEPFAVVVDESDLKRLGMDTYDASDPDKKPKINGREVRLVGTVKGLKSLAAPWVFCSDYTARVLMGAMLPPDHTKYLIVKCDTEADAQALAKELRSAYPEMTAYTADEFSLQSRLYWLFRTKAGVAIGYAALLGLAVGALVTAQTLYAATVASAKEYATLFALGIPRARVYWTVLSQAFWVGLFGVAVAYPMVHLLALGAEAAGTKVVLRWEVLVGASAITLATSLFAGLLALRSVRTIEPMNLLR
jgi:putative ABC transport system permease protein